MGSGPPLPDPVSDSCDDTTLLFASEQIILGFDLYPINHSAHDFYYSL